jgi:predicted XRE-type DNA-binding protein
MIHQMVFDPTDLRNLGAVFDDAWNSILTKHPESAECPELRLRLASLVLRLATDHQLGQEQIKATALRILIHDDLSLVPTG